MQAGAPRRCFFCGEENSVVLEEHHIIPRSLGGENGPTVVLCANCHKKLHYIYDIIFSHLGINRELSTPIKKASAIVFDIIKRAESNGARCVEKPVIIREAEKMGYMRSEVEKAIHKLHVEGIIYELSENCFRIS